MPISDIVGTIAYRIPSLDKFGNIPGGSRGTQETGHVRASEGSFIDDIWDPSWIYKVPVNPKVPPRLDRRDIGISVGTGIPRNKPELVQVQSVPQVRQPIRTGAIQTAPKIARGEATQNPRIIPPIPKGLPKLDRRILNPPTITPAKPKGVLDVLIDIIRPNITTKVQPVALDLGNLLNVGLQAYQSYNTAKVTPVYDPRGFLPWSDVPLDQSIPVGPGAPVGIAPAGSCLPAGYKYDKCGNVVKTRRRRRKRLATSSDIKDLAALSSVTTGAEKKTWIATHPS